MKKKNDSAEKARQHTLKTNPWGHFRSPNAAWTALERRGDTIVLGEPSHSTATQMKSDYHSVYWAARQLDQWKSQKQAAGKQPTIEQANEDFAGSILIGDKHRVPYVTDEELEGQIEHPQAPSKFAEEVVIKRWGFTEATGKTYLHRRSSPGRK